MKTFNAVFTSWYTYAAVMGTFGFFLWYAPRDVPRIGRLMMLYSTAIILGQYLTSRHDMKSLPTKQG